MLNVSSNDDLLMMIIWANLVQSLLKSASITTHITNFTWRQSIHFGMTYFCSITYNVIQQSWKAVLLNLINLEMSYLTGLCFLSVLFSTILTQSAYNRWLSWKVFSHHYIDISGEKSYGWWVDFGFWIWDLYIGLGFGTRLGLDSFQHLIGWPIRGLGKIWHD